MKKQLLMVVALLLTSLSGKAMDGFHYVVAKDGTGDFTTVQEAIDATPFYSKNGATRIFIKKGVYKERISIEPGKYGIQLIGEDCDSVILTNDSYAKKLNSQGNPTGTSGTSTFYAYCLDFYAENITFENSSGPVGQAVACHISSDRAIFRRCRFLGFQDTLYTYGHDSRMYFEDCYIEGTVDFIFGWAQAVFNRCHIHSRGRGYVTAPAQPEGKNCGYVFYDCRLTADEGVTNVHLSRPWRPYGQAVYIRCYIGSHINPEGWDNWGKASNEKTAYYAEYQSYGPGANPEKRVAWSHQLTDLSKYDIHTVLSRDDGWDPVAKTNEISTEISLLLSGGGPMFVKTDCGVVKGFNHEGTMGFLGIPYAKVKRFMPPMPVDKWDTVRVCDHWGPQAMQPTGGRKLSEAEMSEKNSCVLNVWTTDTKASRPVMVWLHGGGFDSGTSAWDPGMHLASRDVVVVSVNHRLNILGFLDLSACGEKYKYSGNVGMLDVVQALQWVQRNIRQFGGDPTNVTIFGESGGGGKVGTLLCMPPAKGLFHKAIIMSGTILNVNTKAMTEELGQAVLKELNIDKAHIDRINDVPYDELYAAGQRAMAASIGTRKPGTPMMWGFGPTPDGEVLLQQPFQNGFASISTDIPILIGTTFNELQRLHYNRELTLQDARKELAKTFGDETDAYISAFAKAWPDYKPQDLLSIDWLFRPKTIITADEIAQSRQAKTWMYMFTWRSPVNKGSVHGHELKFCFDNLRVGDSSLPTPSDDDYNLAKTMSSAWAAFAKKGDPNIGALPEWHPYTKENGELMVLDYSCYIRNNPDRQLEQIIDRHCFRQLDEFRNSRKR